MLKLPFVLLFTAMTAFFWGIYGILLHNGTSLMGNSSLRAFVGVGLAYFLIAVLVPVSLLSSKKEQGYWSVSGTLLSLFAGSVGALGALGVILALAFNAQPIYVMPIVFGGAPVVNTLVTSWINKSFNQIKPLFVVGLVMVIVGAVGVLTNKPSLGGGGHGGEVNFMAVIASIAMAVVCWGAYGPVLHIGQTKMGGSRLRPFCCVGIAYFIIAVAAPIVMLEASPHDGNYTFMGMVWSIIAGAAGAMGALGIILAFTYGGKPIMVMPLVFGFAPVVNTFTSMGIAMSGKDGGELLSKVTSLFIGSLVLGIAGAVTVLLSAPKAKPHGAHAAGSTPATPAAPAKTESHDVAKEDAASDKNA